jgi:hypothetical protein
MSTPLPIDAELPKLKMPAFIPMPIVNMDFAQSLDGVQLRDYFAAKVMAEIQHQCAKGHSDGWDGMAAMAYSYADAMIRVRGKKTRGLNSCY